MWRFWDRRGAAGEASSREEEAEGARSKSPPSRGGLLHIFVFLLTIVLWCLKGALSADGIPVKNSSPESTSGFDGCELNTPQKRRPRFARDGKPPRTPTGLEKSPGKVQSRRVFESVAFIGLRGSCTTLWELRGF